MRMDIDEPRGDQQAVRVQRAARCTFNAPDCDDAAVLDRNIAGEWLGT